MLAGHTYSKGAGVFDQLGQLRSGNLIKVERDGQTFRFTVDRVQRHVRHPSAKEVDSWYDPSVPTRLVLITCGDYLGGGHYASNVVVFAHPV